jgi:hypothetical protein
MERLEFIKVIDLKPDHIVICRLAEDFDPDSMEALRDDLEKLFPTNKVVLLHPDIALEFVAPQAHEDVCMCAYMPNGERCSMCTQDE